MMKSKGIVIATAVAAVIATGGCHQKTPEAGVAYMMDAQKANSTANKCSSSRCKANACKAHISTDKKK